MTHTPLNPGTRALRARSLPMLKGAVYALVAQHAEALDRRDLMVGLAPLYDCAGRLGVHTVTLLEEALAGSALSRSCDAAQCAADFLAREDVDLESFGWTLTRRDGEPAYEPI